MVTWSISSALNKAWGGGGGGGGGLIILTGCKPVAELRILKAPSEAAIRPRITAYRSRCSFYELREENRRKILEARERPTTTTLLAWVPSFFNPKCIKYPYRQYNNLFIFRFVSLLCLRSTLRLYNLQRFFTGGNCFEFSLFSRSDGYLDIWNYFTP